jgi:uncharacterized membrane protein
MGTPVDAGQTIANDALYMTTAAAVVIPAAWPVVAEMFIANCDPGAIYAAGEAWLQVAQEIGDARAAADSARSAAAATGWHGVDQAAYDDKAATFATELLGAEMLAAAVGLALVTMAVILFARIVFIMTLAVALDVWAGLIIAAAASIIGDFGPVEALIVSANEFALQCLGWLSEVTEVLLGVEYGFTATIAGIIGGDVAGALLLGDTQALGNLSQATVDGLGTITAGLVARVFRDGVAWGLRKPLGNVVGDPMSVPGTLAKSLGIVDTAAGQTPIDPVTDWLASLS